MALFDENMAVGKSKYLVTLYLYELTQPSDPLISWGPLILGASPANQSAPGIFSQNCCLRLSNGLLPQIKPHLNSCQYPLINYLSIIPFSSRHCVFQNFWPKNPWIPLSFAPKSQGYFQYFSEHLERRISID